MRGRIEDPGVARLAAEGFTATETAQQLGISRQRVYQIAARDGIVFPLRPRAHSGHPRPPMPLLLTGVACQLNSVVVGAIAELLVAADLISHGWQVYAPIVRHKGHDLIACQPGGEIITVEVRSTKRYVDGRVVRPKSPRRFTSDHFAWVITGEPIIYEPSLQGGKPPEC